MALTAGNVLQRVRDITQDTTPGIFWTDEEIYRWLSDGQREVINLAPAATAQHKSVTFSASDAGSRQTLDTSGMLSNSDPVASRLLYVAGNDGDGDHRPVRPMLRETMDIQIPGWRGIAKDSAGAPTYFAYYVYHEDDPLTIWLYPSVPSSGTYGGIELVYSSIPEDVDASSDSLGVPDVYVGALTDYVIHRCFSKQATYNAARGPLADRHYQQFMTSVLQEKAVDEESDPREDRNVADARG